MDLPVCDIPHAFVICLHFRTTVVAAAAFLDAFQKVADMATNTRGEQMEGCLPALTESSTWALPLGGFSRRYGLSYQRLADSPFSVYF